MDGHDHVVVAGYSPFTDSQRFHRESRFPRSLPAALGLETPTLPGTQAYAGFQDPFVDKPSQKYHKQC